MSLGVRMGLIVICVMGGKSCNIILIRIRLLNVWKLSAGKDNVLTIILKKRGELLRRMLPVDVLSMLLEIGLLKEFLNLKLNRVLYPDYK
jgi:hypothetical protein